MFENLVKRLRRYVEIESSEHHGAELEAEAADAIEKLNKPNNKVHLCSSCTYTYPECPCETDDVIFGNNVGNDNICACAKYVPKTSLAWISTKIDLPPAYEEVFLKFSSNQASGFIDRDGCWSVYSGDGLYTEVADNESKPTHWAKKLSEPTKE